METEKTIPWKQEFTPHMCQSPDHPQPTEGPLPEGTTVMTPCTGPKASQHHFPPRPKQWPSSPADSSPEGGG